MLEINWTPLVYLFIGIFALAGLYKGWWKEAITTIFLIILVFLLQLPPIAQGLINFINFIIFLLWSLLPTVWQATVADFLEAALSVDLGNGPPHIDGSAPQTWIIILIIFIAAAKLVSRSRMPGSGRAADSFIGYVVTWRASLLGGLLGGLNGWLIVNLVRAYLNGRNLPGGEDAIARIPRDVLVQIVELPSTSVTDGFFPWFFIGLSIVSFLVAFRSRVVIIKDKKDGYRQIAYNPPIGHTKYKVTSTE